MKPYARKEGLVVKELPDELLVYDLERHRAHCLNPTAALVWKHSDGQTSVEEIATLLHAELEAPADERLVWLALERLDKSHLLRECMSPPPELARCSRRQLVRKLGLVGGLTVLLPLVTSIVAPTPAEAAASCVVGGCVPIVDDGKPCTSTVPPCNGICSGGSCVGG